MKFPNGHPLIFYLSFNNLRKVHNPSKWLKENQLLFLHSGESQHCQTCKKNYFYLIYIFSTFFSRLWILWKSLSNTSSPASSAIVLYSNTEFAQSSLKQVKMATHRKSITFGTYSELRQNEVGAQSATEMYGLWGKYIKIQGTGDKYKHLCYCEGT